MDSANAASAASQRKPSSLRQRVLSALVLVPLVVGMVWWNLWTVALFAAGAAALAAVELYGALVHGGYRPQTIAGTLLALLPIAGAAAQSLTGAQLILPCMIVVVMLSLVLALPHHATPGALAGWAFTVAGALYTGGLLTHLVLLRELDGTLRPGSLTSLGVAPGAAWLFMVMFITWGQDILAYFVGKYAGRTHMTSLSPKKTWEGAAGGMVGAIAGGVGAVQLFGLPIDIVAAALLGAVGGVVGPLGDLCESFIKRQVGVKDAGHLIPGHGGVLDRIDSLLFTAPTLYYLILLVAP